MASAALKRDPTPFACTVERSALDKALKLVSDTLPAKVIIPITGHVRLTTGADGLTITACDLDREIRATISAEVEGDGDVCVPGAALRGLVAGFPSGAQVSIRLEPTGDRCTIISGRSRYKLSTLPASDFPEIIAPSGASFEMDARAVLEAISCVGFAASTSADRLFLAGTRWHLADTAEGRRMIVMAIDGLVCARKVIGAPSDVDGVPQITIPSEAGAILSKIATAEPKLIFCFSEERAMVEAGGVRFITKLVDGQFPDYPRIVPPLSGRAATFDRQAMLGALQRLSILEGDKSSHLSIRDGEGGLIVAGRSSMHGDGIEHVEAEIHSDDGKIGFAVSRRRLADCLARFSGEHVRLDQSEPHTPIRLIAASPADADFDCVVMPMRAALHEVV